MYIYTLKYNTIIIIKQLINFKFLNQTLGQQEQENYMYICQKKETFIKEINNKLMYYSYYLKYKGVLRISDYSSFQGRFQSFRSLFIFLIGS